ncbi:lipoyl(octanoyl) transferase [Leptospira gomenensis]|uniref:Octanoyltransferase n=1 Tax=Leptospira gomenensis TaxID=2484974 RepID=A0A5F1YCR4_9LEPT|nr:lipoyl(octanoyl) transferase LipB [Leptospira gomenensis]TGK33182.1 lipoyl(octanoyl) transferase [Leptospira gomenensis]TGK35584.1 lipoyl(octanoyl) transferase [Leptospira gomenensis]TGK40908.1 lipoyl(octanoyl) transferase [Leptospira gomenensis]TGK61198.1 lipoyl(octanoyl) transferase [Leptospira gomenensis]
MIELEGEFPYLRYVELQEKFRKFRKESILFLEHAPTITAGSNYNLENLLFGEEFLKSKGIDVHFIQRGGDFTAHEPGQLVIYAHVDLKKRSLSIRSYLENFLGALTSAALQTWNLALELNPEAFGLYLASDPTKKICSIGVNFKSFFTSYGIAFNVNNDFQTFRRIHPCGRNWTDMTNIRNLGLDSGVSKRAEFISNVRKNLGAFLDSAANGIVSV